MHNDENELTIGELEAVYEGRTIGDLEDDVPTVGDLDGAAWSDRGDRTWDDLDAPWGDAA